MSKTNWTPSPHAPALYRRSGDVLLLDSTTDPDAPEELQISVPFANSIKDGTTCLQAGVHFVVSGGSAMLDLPKYYRHEVVNAVKRATKLLSMDMRMNAVSIVNKAFNDLEQQVANTAG